MRRETIALLGNERNDVAGNQGYAGLDFFLGLRGLCLAWGRESPRQGIRLAREGSNLDQREDLLQDIIEGQRYPSATLFAGDDSHLPPSAAAPRP